MLSGEGVVICENSCLSSALSLKATNKILSQVNPKVVAKDSSKQHTSITRKPSSSREVTGQTYFH